MAARNVQGIAPRKGPVEQFRAWILNPSVYWPLSVVTVSILAGLDATVYDAILMRCLLRWIAAQLYVALGMFSIPATMELETLIWFPIVWGGVLGMLLIVQKKAFAALLNVSLSQRPIMHSAAKQLILPLCERDALSFLLPSLLPIFLRRTILPGQDVERLRAAIGWDGRTSSWASSFESVLALLLPLILILGVRVHFFSPSPRTRLAISALHIASAGMYELYIAMHHLGYDFNVTLIDMALMYILPVFLVGVVSIVGVNYAVQLFDARNPMRLPLFNSILTNVAKQIGAQYRKVMPQQVVWLNSHPAKAVDYAAVLMRTSFHVFASCCVSLWAVEAVPQMVINMMRVEHEGVSFIPFVPVHIYEFKEPTILTFLAAMVLFFVTLNMVLGVVLQVNHLVNATSILNVLWGVPIIRSVKPMHETGRDIGRLQSMVSGLLTFLRSPREFIEGLTKGDPTLVAFKLLYNLLGYMQDAAYVKDIFMDDAALSQARFDVDVIVDIPYTGEFNLHFDPVSFILSEQPMDTGSALGSESGEPVNVLVVSIKAAEPEQMTGQPNVATFIVSIRFTSRLFAPLMNTVKWAITAKEIREVLTNIPVLQDRFLFKLNINMRCFQLDMRWDRGTASNEAAILGPYVLPILRWEGGRTEGRYKFDPLSVLGDQGKSFVRSIRSQDAVRTVRTAALHSLESSMKMHESHWDHILPQEPQFQDMNASFKKALSNYTQLLRVLHDSLLRYNDNLEETGIRRTTVAPRAQLANPNLLAAPLTQRTATALDAAATSDLKVTSTDAPRTILMAALLELIKLRIAIQGIVEGNKGPQSEPFLKAASGIWRSSAISLFGVVYQAAFVTLVEAPGVYVRAADVSHKVDLLLLCVGAAQLLFQVLSMEDTATVPPVRAIEPQLATAANPPIENVSVQQPAAPVVLVSEAAIDAAVPHPTGSLVQHDVSGAPIADLPAPAFTLLQEGGAVFSPGPVGLPQTPSVETTTTDGSESVTSSVVDSIQSQLLSPHTPVISSPSGSAVISTLEPLRDIDAGQVSRNLVVHGTAATNFPHAAELLAQPTHELHVVLVGEKTAGAGPSYPVEFIGNSHAIWMAGGSSPSSSQTTVPGDHIAASQLTSIDDGAVLNSFQVGHHHDIVVEPPVVLVPELPVHHTAHNDVGVVTAPRVVLVTEIAAPMTVPTQHVDQIPEIEHSTTLSEPLPSIPVVHTHELQPNPVSPPDVGAWAEPIVDVVLPTEPKHSHATVRAEPAIQAAVAPPLEAVVATVSSLPVLLTPSILADTVLVETLPEHDAMLAVTPTVEVAPSRLVPVVAEHQEKLSLFHSYIMEFFLDLINIRDSLLPLCQDAKTCLVTQVVSRGNQAKDIPAAVRPTSMAAATRSAGSDPVVSLLEHVRGSWARCTKRIPSCEDLLPLSDYSVAFTEDKIVSDLSAPWDARLAFPGSPYSAAECLSARQAMNIALLASTLGRVQRTSEAVCAQVQLEAATVPELSEQLLALDHAALHASHVSAHIVDDSKPVTLQLDQISSSATALASVGTTCGEFTFPPADVANFIFRQRAAAWDSMRPCIATHIHRSTLTFIKLFGEVAQVLPAIRGAGPVTDPAMRDDLSRVLRRFDELQALLGGINSFLGTPTPSANVEGTEYASFLVWHAYRMLVVVEPLPEDAQAIATRLKLTELNGNGMYQYIQPKSVLVSTVGADWCLAKERAAWQRGTDVLQQKLSQIVTVLQRKL